MGRSNCLCWLIFWLRADQNTATFSSTFGHMMQLLSGIIRCALREDHGFTLDTDIIEALQEELHACDPHVRMLKGTDIGSENQDVHIVLCSPTGKPFD